MTRQNYGSGSLLDQRGGKYRLTISRGSDPVTGKPIRITRTVRAPSKKAAFKLLAEFQSEAHGTNQAGTLGALLDEYMDARPDMSPSTRADFEGYRRRALTEPLRRKPIGELTARDLDALYLHLLRKGGKGGKALAPASVRRVHVILHAALAQAVRWGYITSNPADRARPPRQDAAEVTLPPADHLVRLLAKLDTLENSPLPTFVALLLATGARPGELCALTWGAVDLKARKVTIAASVARGQGRAVVKETKTRKVRRPTIAGGVVDVLTARRDEHRKLCLAAGVPLESFPVFPSKGRAERPWRPDSMSREFRTVRDDLGLSDDLTLRNLRHWCVSVLAEAGVDVVTAAKRMGHDPAVMLGVYAHLFEHADLAAAEILAGRAAGLRS